MSELRDIVKKHKFLSLYLQYTGVGESPDIFNLWCAITGVSATLSRKFYFPHGNGAIFPNIYAIIVGAPGSRKTTAVNTLQKMLIEGTRVKFAPTDIAGMRQGLLSVLVGEELLEESFHNKNKSNTDEAIGLRDIDVDDIFNQPLNDVIEHPNDKTSLFVCAGELQSFLGLKSIELIGCLGTLYDNLPEYKYQLKTSNIVIQEPTLQLLGAITPNSFFECMPDGTMNSGFLSRFIMIASSEKRKFVPRMARGDPAIREELVRNFSTCYHSVRGELTETSEAMTFIDSLYTSFLSKNNVNDVRFQYYLERRHDHFYKLLMVLVASDGRTEATLEDAKLADAILIFTETNMTHALGEYGTSKDSKIKQRILEYVRNETMPVPHAILIQQFRNDIKGADLAIIMEQLVADKKLHKENKYFSAKYNMNGIAYAKI